MPELVINLHMHTRYSDGTGDHKDIARAALQAGLDAVIITDHNLLVHGFEGFHHGDDRRVLLLVGEEVHDPGRQPQKNHLLVFGANRELAPFAARPQRLIDQVEKQNGLSFIAHPYDPEQKVLGEPDISWEDWDVRGFTGIELWNAMSEMKSIVRGRLDGLIYTLLPQYIARGPHPLALQKWDELTARGQRVVAVGGSDAHAFKMRLGPIRRTVFPYRFHFQAINTHLLVEQPLSGDLEADRQSILDALRRGRAFIGYDLPASTRGFRFSAQALERQAQMGDEVRLNRGVTLQIRLPATCECRLLRDGAPIQTWRDSEICTHIAAKPGVYRVECYLEYMGRRRGWIFSNPIYVRA
jgi:hypothetical protein